MWRAILPVFVMIAGCSFARGSTPVTGQPGAEPDAGPGPGSGTTAAACHVADSTIRLCLDFEGNVVPTAVDLSTGYHDATTLAVMPMPRGTQQAVQLISESLITVPETVDLDISQFLSIEMWLAPSTRSDPTSYPLANRTQYAMSYDRDGLLGCAVGTNATGTSRDLLALNVFTHVGCTYDGAMVRLFVGGDVVGCRSAHGPIPTGGTTGTSIGAGRFLGGMDDIHVYARALTASEMCARAGRIVCNTVCPAT